jgi:hypothetical protein
MALWDKWDKRFPRDSWERRRRSETGLTAVSCGSNLPFFSTGCGSAWLERHVRDVEAVGSNPTSPIQFRSKLG